MDGSNDGHQQQQRAPAGGDQQHQGLTAQQQAQAQQVAYAQQMYYQQQQQAPQQQFAQAYFAQQQLQQQQSAEARRVQVLNRLIQYVQQTNPGGLQVLGDRNVQAAFYELTLRPDLAPQLYATYPNLAQFMRDNPLVVQNFDALRSI